ncbi:MAG TPA: hypothetical protein PKA02_04570 [Candidatus Saccharibacteria bacterium]|nr:hypothetical protein [Candidatus Saccharibacteria bacterium]
MVGPIPPMNVEAQAELIAEYQSAERDRILRASWDAHNLLHGYARLWPVYEQEMPQELQSTRDPLKVSVLGLALVVTETERGGITIPEATQALVIQRQANAGMYAKEFLNCGMWLPTEQRVSRYLEELARLGLCDEYNDSRPDALFSVPRPDEVEEDFRAFLKVSRDLRIPFLHRL